MDNPKHSKRVVLILLIASAASRFSNPIVDMTPKPRILATIDGEIDDQCSMVRFLLYTNEWDDEEIIHISSRFHWAGGMLVGETEVKARGWEQMEWLDRQIDANAEVYDNLRQHYESFSTTDELRSKVFVGNIVATGEMELDTHDAHHIVEVLLDDKPEPVYLQAWDGTNTISKALKKIQDAHPDQIKKVSHKSIIYIILDQDKTFP